MKTLREQVGEIISKAVDYYSDASLDEGIEAEEAVDQIIELVEKEVIGEDDDMRLIESGEDKLGIYDIYAGDAKSVKERNYLRAEQRSKLDPKE